MPSSSRRPHKRSPIAFPTARPPPERAGRGAPLRGGRRSATSRARRRNRYRASHRRKRHHLQRKVGFGRRHHAPARFSKSTDKFVWSAAVIYIQRNNSLCLMCRFSRSPPKEKKKSERRISPRVIKVAFSLCIYYHKTLFFTRNVYQKRDDDDDTNKRSPKFLFSSRPRAFDDVLGRPFVPFFRQKAPRSRERERERG